MSNFEGVILLEVSEVIRLRKGLANIHKEIKDGLLKIIGNHNSKTKFRICISLNCQATEWMCLNTKPNSSTVILNYDLMIKKIKSIHVDLILNAYKISNSLEGLGIKTIGQILKIPRKKIRRRFNNRLLDDLDLIFNKNVVSRLNTVKKSVPFEEKKDFTHPVTEKEYLLHELKKILKSLCKNINEQHLGTRRVNLFITTENKKKLSYEISVDLSQGTSSFLNIFFLIKEKFNYIKIEEPVTSIKVIFQDIQYIEEKTDDLIIEKKKYSLSIIELIAVLSSKLKQSSIISFNNQINYAPELKFKKSFFSGKIYPNNTITTTDPDTQDVIWIYDSPLLLKKKYEMPLYKGELKICLGPERIETNWWTKYPLRRDYYIAETKNNEKLWVYRTPEKKWYLHGKIW